MAYSIDGVASTTDGVVITIREWDGVDRPERTRLSPIPAEEARKLAETIASTADEVERLREGALLKLIKDKEKKLEELGAELDQLRFKLGQLQTPQ